MIGVKVRKPMDFEKGRVKHSLDRLMEIINKIGDD